MYNGALKGPDTFYFTKVGTVRNIFLSPDGIMFKISETYDDARGRGMSNIFN